MLKLIEASKLVNQFVSFVKLNETKAKAPTVLLN